MGSLKPQSNHRQVRFGAGPELCAPGKPLPMAGLGVLVSFCGRDLTPVSPLGNGRFLVSVRAGVNGDISSVKIGFQHYKRLVVFVKHDTRKRSTVQHDLALGNKPDCDVVLKAALINELFCHKLWTLPC